MRESAIQKAILNYLQLKENMQDVWFMRTNNFAGQIQRRDGYRSWIKNVKRGAPDVLVCYRGQFIGLEIKNEKGHQTPDQLEAQKRIEQAGGRYYVVRSLEEVLKIIK